ncbi:methyltransferase domain-containing protein [Alteromonadaceae bacterium BrNp21-10]|nr:methyltransferase domain-containing protein [Alteromonadaceae bacterium BrNp21-10]
MNPNDKPDQSFDSIANKFQRNIYGTSKGQLRHQLLLEYLQPYLTQKPLSILDAGGGSGQMTQALLELGHNVHLLDVSEDMLVIAQQQCHQFADFSVEQNSIQQHQPQQQYDMVLCHAVLEWLQDPMPVIKLMTEWLKPQGHLSLSFFNRDAQLFGNALYGNFDYIDKDLKVGNRVRLNPNNALVPQQVLACLAELPLEVQHQAGIRCIHDYVRDKSLQQSHYQQILELERRFGKQHPYMWLGKYFHIIAQRFN